MIRFIWHLFVVFFFIGLGLVFDHKAIDDLYKDVMKKGLFQ